MVNFPVFKSGFLYHPSPDRPVPSRPQIESPVPHNVLKVYSDWERKQSAVVLQILEGMWKRCLLGEKVVSPHQNSVPEWKSATRGFLIRMRIALEQGVLFL